MRTHSTQIVLEVTTSGSFRQFARSQRPESISLQSMFEECVPLSRYSSYRIGGDARYFFAPKDVAGLLGALELWRKVGGTREEIFVLGGGTNLLIHDQGFRGLVVKPEMRIIEVKENCVRVGAGTLVSDLLNFLIAKGLAGMEWAGGLPGTVGGAIRGNAGAFGGEIKDVIRGVVSLPLSGNVPKVVRRKVADCRFGYRTSVFKELGGDEIILEATLALQHGDKKKIQEAIEEKIQYRKERHPMEYPNIGSIFKNVDFKKVPQKLRASVAHVVKTDPFPVVPTAYLLAEAGLKGVSFGGAMISPKHPNFIVNALNASSLDVLNLITLAKQRVKEKFDIALEEEVLYVQ